MTSQRSRSPRLRVLESVGSIKPTTNPYLAQLIAALGRRDDVDVRFFSFMRCIVGRYDVFHVHWPEVLFGGHRAVGRLVRRVMISICLLRLALTRVPIVRTWHNTERPAGLSRWDHAILDAFDRRTTVRIRLNGATALPSDVPVVTAPLGHYRDWFADAPRADRVAGRIAYVGLIRGYKGVGDLVAAFRNVDSSDASLAITGKSSSAELESTIRELAGHDPRITLRFGFVSDADFVHEITAAEIVALPFVHMHNSSTVLAALSLERPTLVPDNEVNRLIAAEVGPGWLYLYAGPLTGRVIEETMERLRTDLRAASPNLDARGWDEAARLHADAFRLALRR